MKYLVCFALMVAAVSASGYAPVAPVKVIQPVVIPSSGYGARPIIKPALVAVPATGGYNSGRYARAADIQLAKPVVLAVPATSGYGRPAVSSGYGRPAVVVAKPVLANTGYGYSG